MRKLMTALAFAAFALAPDAGLLLPAGGEDDYPSPTLDGDEPEIRFPGDPRT